MSNDGREGDVKAEESMRAGQAHYFTQVVDSIRLGFDWLVCGTIFACQHEQHWATTRCRIIAGTNYATQIFFVV